MEIGWGYEVHSDSLKHWHAQSEPNRGILYAHHPWGLAW